jgi:SDR family mycofactocin-dependent oxidoreductase
VSRVAGKVALITGAGRGMGRSHALRLASEGAAIVAVDACTDLATVPYPMAGEADLLETVRRIEADGGRAIARQADVRDLVALEAAVRDAISAFGSLDVVVANAGISSYAPVWEITEEMWQEMIDVNLTGVWKTVKAAVPAMLEQGTGGSLILISSLGGLEGMLNIGHYVAAKHGVTGLTKTLAAELAPTMIRANSVHPSTVITPLVDNPACREMLTGGNPNATPAEVEAALMPMNAMPIPWIEPIDVSNAVLWLASDESRYVTGTALLIDAGAQAPFKIPHQSAS